MHTQSTHSLFTLALYDALDQNQNQDIKKPPRHLSAINNNKVDMAIECIHVT